MDTIHFIWMTIVCLPAAFPDHSNPRHYHSWKSNQPPLGNIQCTEKRVSQCRMSCKIVPGYFLWLLTVLGFHMQNQSSNEQQQTALGLEVKHSPIRASNWSLFNCSIGTSPKTVKRVVVSLNSGVFPSFSMTPFSYKVYQWGLCGSPHCSQVARVNSTVQIPHTPALFIWSQKNPTFPLSSIASVRNVNPTHQNTAATVFTAIDALLHVYSRSG